MQRKIVYLLLIIIITGTGCSAKVQKVKETLYWPKPPDTPKIEFVKNIQETKDIGIKKNIFFKILEKIVGEEQAPKIITPIGVYADNRNRLFVSDTGLQVVHVFDNGKKRYDQIFKLPEGRLLSPIGITADNNGNIYVTDSFLNFITVYDNKYKFKKIIKKDKFTRLAGIAFNNKNNLLYVVDTGGHKVYAISPEGDIVKEIGQRGNSDTTFNFPTYIAIDKEGSLYITDSLNFRVLILDEDGNFINKIGELGKTLGTFSKPKGIAVDSDVNIYVVDGLYDTVQIFNKQGDLLMNFGSSGVQNGYFWLPAGIAIDSNNYIYIADTYNKRVSVYRYLYTNDAESLQNIGSTNHDLQKN